MIMKTNELMQGDWVIYPINIPKNPKVRITEIRKDNIKVCVRTETFSADGVDVECLQPIPLTPEILEKNGLTNHRFSDSDFVDYEEWYSDDKTLRVVKDERGMFARVEDEQLMYMKVGGIVEFVHDWQHLLKHAKIEKEIIL